MTKQEEWEYLMRLAADCRDEEKYATGIVNLEAALKLAENLSPKDLAFTLKDLADLYHAQKRDVEAEPLYLRALEIRETLIDLAMDYFQSRKYIKGIVITEEALQLAEYLTTNRIHTLNWFAKFYESQRLYAEAETLYLRALEIRVQPLECEYIDISSSLNELANLYVLQKRYIEAEPLYVRALEIREQQLGSKHLDVATSLSNLANLYVLKEDWDVEAETLYVRALEIRVQQLGYEHLDVATSLNNLANLYKSLHQYEEAEPLYLRALEIRERQLDSQHIDVAISLNNLANLYKSLDRHEEAEPLYLRAVKIEEISIDMVIDCFRHQKYIEGIIRAEEAFKLAESLTKDRIDILNWFAEFYESQGLYYKAESIQKC